MTGRRGFIGGVLALTGAALAPRLEGATLEESPEVGDAIVFMPRDSRVPYARLEVVHSNGLWPAGWKGGWVAYVNDRFRGSDGVIRHGLSIRWDDGDNPRFRVLALGPALLVERPSALAYMTSHHFATSFTLREACAALIRKKNQKGEQSPNHYGYV